MVREAKSGVAEHLHHSKAGRPGSTPTPAGIHPHKGKHHQQSISITVTEHNRRGTEKYLQKMKNHVLDYFGPTSSHHTLKPLPVPALLSKNLQSPHQPPNSSWAKHPLQESKFEKVLKKVSKRTASIEPTERAQRESRYTPRPLKRIVRNHKIETNKRMGSECVKAKNRHVLPVPPQSEKGDDNAFLTHTPLSRAKQVAKELPKKICRKHLGEEKKAKGPN